MNAPRRIFWTFWVLAAALLAIACLTACAGGPTLVQSHRIGTDDDAYAEMRRQHRVRCCPTAAEAEPCVYTGNPACTNEATVLEEYRLAIQGYLSAAEIPGDPALQKERLDLARAAAKKLFPSGGGW